MPSRSKESEGSKSAKKLRVKRGVPVNPQDESARRGERNSDHQGVASPKNFARAWNEKAEELIRAGEVRFRTVADSLPELISFVDAKQRYQFCNKTYQMQFGISPQKFKGRRVRELLGEDVYAVVRPYIEKALAGEATSFEGYISHEKLGRRYEHIDYIPYRDERGRILGFYVVIRNLTALKTAEEKFRAFVETAPQAIIIHDEKGKIAVVNRETEHIFGYSREELIGQEVEMLMPAGFRQKHVSERKAYLHRPTVRPMGAGMELYGLRKDHSEFPAEISLSPVETPQGTLVSSTVIDITERKRNEEQMRWATVLAERARMARDVHDTLAQGFTGIVLNLEAAEEAPNVPKEVRDRIQRARELARESLEEARNSILALSSPLPPNGNLTSSLRGLAGRYRSHRKTRVEFSASGPAPHLSSVVEATLLRIAQQALDNAMQHADATTIRLGITLDHGQVQLQIEDDGRGFELRKARCGMGLTGMRERASEIGAKFQLASKPGRGTRIRVTVLAPQAQLSEVSR